MNPEIRRFIRFIATGMLNTCFGYASFAILVLTGMPLWLAVAGSTGMAILFNFFSYGSLVFGNTSARVLPRFLALYVATGCINYALLHLILQAGLHALVAQTLCLPVLALLGFIGMRTFVFAAAARQDG